MLLTTCTSGYAHLIFLQNQFSGVEELVTGFLCILNFQIKFDYHIRSCFVESIINNILVVLIIEKQK